jgi:hypothetical protein
MKNVGLTIYVIKNAPLEFDEDDEIVNPPVLLQKNYEAILRNEGDFDSIFSFEIHETVQFNDLKSNLFFDIRGDRIGSHFSHLQVQVGDGVGRYNGKNSIRNFLKIPLITLNGLSTTLDSSQGEKQPSFFSQLQFVLKFSIPEV